MLEHILTALLAITSSTQEPPSKTLPTLPAGIELQPPEEKEMPTSTEIYGSKVIIMILLQENPMAIMIDNKAVAASFRKYFYILWNTAKRSKVTSR